MKHIISRFFEKHNPCFFVLRFGLGYSAVLTLLALFFLYRETPIYQTIELLLVAAITAFLQALIGFWLLTLCKKEKDEF